MTTSSTFCTSRSHLFPHSTDYVVLMARIRTDVTVERSAAFGNILIHIMDRVLSIPGDLPKVADAKGLSSVQSLLNDAGITDVLQRFEGYTLFAPSNDAIAAASAQFAGLGSDKAAQANVLKNHVCALLPVRHFFP